MIKCESKGQCGEEKVIEEIKQCEKRHRHTYTQHKQIKEELFIHRKATSNSTIAQ